MRSLVEEAYFERVVEAMREKGFRLFSQVTVSTDDVGYHVPVSAARVTSLFFHVPDKNLLLAMAYYEDDYNKEEFRGYWHLRVHLEFSSSAAMLEALGSLDDEEVPTADQVISCAGFRHVGWSLARDFQFSWNLDQELPHSVPLQPVSLAGNIRDMTEGMLTHLTPAPFHEIQVTSWPPQRVKGCEPIFWKRFEESSARICSSKYLWSLVKRPWGSEGLHGDE